METTTKPETTTINLPRFGEFTYAQSDVFEFPLGLPGFRQHRRWLFLTLESQPSFVWLQSLDDVEVAVPAANPWTIFAEYDPQLPPETFAALAITDPASFTLLCVVVVGPDAREMTMNLACPILVNLRSRKAIQVDLERSGYATREPIPRTFDHADAALTAKAS